MLDGRIHIPADLSTHGLPSLLLGLDLPDVAGLPSLRVLDNRQAVLTAEAVGCFAHLAVGVLAIVITNKITRGSPYRKMRVDGSRVDVGRYNDKEIFISPQLVCKPDSYLVCFFCIHLPTRKTLIGVVCDGL